MEGTVSSADHYLGCLASTCFVGENSAFARVGLMQLSDGLAMQLSQAQAIAYACPLPCRRPSCTASFRRNATC